MGRLTLPLYLALVLASGLPGKAWSQDYDAGLAAYGQGNAARAEVNWLMAAANGSSEAEFALGKLYEEGGADVGADPERAATWYRRAMQRGSLAAETNFALLLLEGRGLVRDSQRAVDLWQNAAEAGQAEAQYNLALAYYNGIGVAPRLRRAAEWMELAAENGLPAAQFGLSEFYRLGIGVQRDSGQAAAWEERARGNGYGRDAGVGAPAEAEEPLAVDEPPAEEERQVTVTPEPQPDRQEPPSAEAEAEPNSDDGTREVSEAPDIPAIPGPPEQVDPAPPARYASPPETGFASRETALSATISAILEGEDSDFSARAERGIESMDERATEVSEMPLSEAEVLAPEMSEAVVLNGAVSDSAKVAAESADPKQNAIEEPEAAPEPEAALEPVPEPETVPEVPQAAADSQTADVGEPVAAAGGGNASESSAAESDFAVWLGSMQSQEGASRLWQEARATHPDLLGDRSVHYQTVETDRGAYRRVLAGGFSSREDAGAFCERLRTSNDDAFCQPLRKE
ncbi:SPOR domain-containing protein [Aquibaculum arenosum]|uniref:SPOR domain-containing protein n=1 Tax=Aquibaculum arenosum TaxID=3032591 RepID=A0ABT5YK59_9PROT|nr:SPOR domain-containing protein [Fodinicurvata sp. CAU 1616]MDF2095279.1 SPOR domain-containing protein [Fodinicurvata sp. CAU 1616]